MGRSPAKARDTRDPGSVPGWELPGVGNGTLLQYSCLGNPMGREAWWATVCRESDTTEHIMMNRICVYREIVTLVGVRCD